MEGPDSDAIRGRVQNLGVLLREMGRFPEAEAELLRALRLAENGHGANSDEVASALSALGRLRQLEERPAEAVQTLKRSLDIRLSLFGPDDSRTKMTSKRLDEVKQATQ